MADVAEDGPFTNAATAISQGKRHLLVRDYTAAVTAFAQGLELLAKKHGDCGDELGEPYLLYGRALLELAREEAGVLGGGVPGSEGAEETEEADEDVDDEEGDDDKLSNIEEKGDEENEDENTHDLNKTDDKKIEEKNTDENVTNKTAENVTESIPGSSKEAITTNGQILNEEKNSDNIPSGSGEQNDESEDINKEEDEDDPGRGIDLQVAWEVLELAKMVFFKRGKSGFKHLAEAYRLLGEVAMESGNHQVAVSDLEQALKILQNVEPYESRSIAELHYQLGLAYSLLNDFDASIEQFNEATNLLETRIKELENTKEPPKTDDPFYTIEGEIKELKELLPEIQEKIVDMKDFKQEACRLVIEGIKSKVAGNCTNGAGTSAESASSTSPTVNDAISPKETKPASDISHLVRKKRKADEPEEEIALPCKKPST